MPGEQGHPAAGDPPITSMRRFVEELHKTILSAQRHGVGVAPAELARKTGVSPQSIYAYRRGTTLPPNDVFERLLDSIEVTGAQRGYLCSLRDEAEIAQRAHQGRGPRAGGSIAVAQFSSPRPPRQLPRQNPHFVGRNPEIQSLASLVEHARPGPGTGSIAVIGGSPGIGKTTLAVYWAHQVADRFPDGQLYVNLRGFDSTRQVMEPAEAVRRFLDALDVPAERLPVDLDAQAALYRSHLADRRMLVVLDNALDTAQVRPLLPGATTCLVLVTSRNQLTGLVAVDGAHPITLDILSVDEAFDLLARRLGPHRLAAESEAVTEIIRVCAGLPLALSIVAARATIHVHLPLRTHVNELQHSSTRLDVLTTEEPGTDVQSVFSWSYRALTPPAARLFRLLGLHPGPEISTTAAASLAALDIPQIREPLAELVGASLLNEYDLGRYTFHDLLRVYAAALAHDIDPEDERVAAINRVLDHYLHTANAAALLLDPTRDPIPIAPARPGVSLECPADHAQALEWFTAEHAALRATIDYAQATGFDTHTWQLAWTLDDYLDRRAHWHDLVATCSSAVTAAARLADTSAEARAHRALAFAYTELGRFDDARTHLRYALDLHHQAGDLTGKALTHHYLSYVCGRQDQHREALDHAQQALEFFRVTSHQVGQASALNQVGWEHALLGDHQQAITFCEQALTLLQELDNRPGQASTWDSLGYAHHHLGHHAQAVTCYQHAISLYRDLGDRYNEADTFSRLGDSYYEVGKPYAARDAWQQALTILEDLDHPSTDQIRAQIRDLDIPS